jgi:hypothetical protein
MFSRRYLGVYLTVGALVALAIVLAAGFWAQQRRDARHHRVTGGQQRWTMAPGDLPAWPGVLDVGQVRLRWIGHQLHAECEIIVDADASAVEAHQAAVSAEHDLLHALPRLSSALVHADPQPRQSTDHHAALAPHR